ncbi:nitroreductase family protein [Propylenella binzhouense]|uniref:NADPH-dependent oxidoreductase n=1 Tax=Propylenella binzhouense TaxID=2555902 RepID=A0A964T912_9HYPH|nr:nitroreductase family protein [Propylenella binzhouense]MYZ49572.1 NADPH-dependent oxidoreductase [Propylenella binzhouense]
MIRPEEALADVLERRFGEAFAIPEGLAGLETLARMAGRGSVRRFEARPVDPALLRLLCACALAAPTKSDLQQRDIVIVSDPALRAAVEGLLVQSPWAATAPVFLVFCANGRRLPAISELRGKPFPNDHFDLLFNAIGDAAIALAAFTAAAEAAGLGCCPISELRNHAAAIGDLLGLPDRVIPFAGLCLGWPAEEAGISPRLPLAVTVHENRYREDALAEALAAYDSRRSAVAPYPRPIRDRKWGAVPDYGWSEHKARQYAEPQRTDFGAYVRRKGFSVE